MSLQEQVKGKAEQFKGRAEQAVGKASESAETQARGMIDEVKGKARASGLSVTSITLAVASALIVLALIRAFASGRRGDV
jgi:uncharacterized protein YjbJ (UPF0337 family)